MLELPAPMFEKGISDCPGKTKTDIWAKRLKILILVFFLGLVVVGQLSSIKAAGPISSTEVPLGRQIPALNRVEESLKRSNFFRPLVGINSFRGGVNLYLKQVFDQVSNRFFRQFLETASPRLIIVNPVGESLKPTPTIAWAATLTPEPTNTPTVTPTPTVEPTTTVTPTPTPSPTVTVTPVPTEAPTLTPSPTPTLAVATPTPTAAITPTAAPPTSVGYVVSGGGITKDGQTIALNGVNWFGFETANHVVHGLWSRNWKEMISQIKGAGFNSVRIPFCPATVRNESVSGIDYSQNSDLSGLKSLEVLDKIVGELNNQGMYFVLDHHTPDCSAISELPASGGYSEDQWVADLVAMTNRYKSYPNFLGMDLKNEPHGAATWGTGGSTDWKLSAEKAGKAVLAADPNILVFVEGIQNNPTCSNNAVAHWWGGNLEPQTCYPLDLPADRLVLSPHVYGPDVFVQDYFNAADFPSNLPKIWEAHFGFLAGKYALAMGEWGGKYGGGNPKDVAWQNALVDYLSQKGICNSFYWSWNPNSGDTGGILQDDWKTVRQDKVNLLQKYASQCRVK